MHAFAEHVCRTGTSRCLHSKIWKTPTTAPHSFRFTTPSSGVPTTHTHTHACTHTLQSLCFPSIAVKDLNPTRWDHVNCLLSRHCSLASNSKTVCGRGGPPVKDHMDLFFYLRLFFLLRGASRLRRKVPRLFYSFYSRYLSGTVLFSLASGRGDL